MNKIIYHGGNLFKAPKEKTILVHAVNCMGKWGSGIAYEFKQRFPEAHIEYQAFCRKHSPENTIGMALQFHRPGYQSVGCLFTSRNYGSEIDSEDDILLHTKQAVRCLLTMIPPTYEVHAPKINSGLFRVPWEKTEAVIEKLLDNRSVKFHIWEGK